MDEEKIATYCCNSFININIPTKFIRVPLPDDIK